MAKTYTAKTASLKATTVDVRKIDAEEINVWTGDTTNKKERVNLLDLISDSNIIYDDRGGNTTDNDIWPNPIALENTHITTDTKGNISINYIPDTYKTFDYSKMTDAHKTILQSAAKVVDNKVYGADGQLLMNWETAAFTNSRSSEMNGIFGGTSSQKAPITEWDSDLSSLTYGGNMFAKTALTSFNGDLSNLINGWAMFHICSSLTSFNGDLSSLTSGGNMFAKTALKSFSGDLSSLVDGAYMFSYTPLESFNSNLSSLTNGNRMFYNSALESFNGDLSSLTSGSAMFQYTDIQSFNDDLPSLTSGSAMFANTALQSFDSDLSSLENGYHMFYGSALQSFSSDLPNLTNGTNMFCYAALQSFNGDLPSLTNGSYMFYNCKLNAESVHNILHTINPDEKTGENEGSIPIGINIINDSTREAQKLEFAKECLCDSWNELNAEFTAKHWTVDWQFNGVATSTASTLELTDSTISTALWAKLEEVTDENEPYEYISLDTNKHYNISWFHETNGSTEGYEYFGSLLEACGAFGVIPKEYA